MDGWMFEPGLTRLRFVWPKMAINIFYSAEIKFGKHQIISSDTFV